MIVTHVPGIFGYAIVLSILLLSVASIIWGIVKLKNGVNDDCNARPRYYFIYVIVACILGLIFSFRWSEIHVTRTRMISAVIVMLGMLAWAVSILYTCSNDDIKPYVKTTLVNATIVIISSVIAWKQLPSEFSVLLF
jgi:hypothetical protein